METTTTEVAPAAAGAGAVSGLAPEVLRQAYRTMYLSRKVDDKEIQLKNQSQIFFQISGAGHEAILAAAGLLPAAWLRLVLSLLPRPRAVPGARRDAARDVPAGRRVADDPASRGRQMPSHWGHTRLQHRLAGQPDRRRSASRPSAAPRPAGSTSASRPSPAASARFQADEVAYVSLGDGSTSEGEFWESLNSACNAAAAGGLSRRGQRLRHLGAGRGADARRQHRRARRVVPGPARRERRRHRLPRQLPRHGRGRRLRPGAPRARLWCAPPSSARTRTRCRTTNGCTRRRTSARRKAGAIR